MNAEPRNALLSREELDALLTELGEAADELVTGLHGGLAPRLLPIARSVGEFTSEQSRAMSTLYQRGIEFRTLDLQEVPLHDFASFLIPVDRVVVLHFEPGPWVGYLLLGRSLVFSWLTLAFGAQEDTPPFPVPDRHYTRIEERFMRRIAQELAAQLAIALRNRGVAEVSVQEIVEPEAIPASPDKIHLASIDVEGLGDLCRLRVALPAALLPEELPAAIPEAPTPAPPPRLRSAVMETPVSVQVRAGHAELSLGQVAALKPGDVLELTPEDQRGFVVRVENEDRFVAIGGSVGGRLAVQVTEPA